MYIVAGNLNHYMYSGLCEFKPVDSLGGVRDAGVGYY